MNFDDYLQPAYDHQALNIDPSWGQGRTTFGGLSAALLLAQVEQQADAGQILRSLSISFCGPLQTGVPFTLQVQPRRAGKSVAHYQAEAWQNDELVTLLNACYGRERVSAVEVAYPLQPLGKPGSGTALPYIKGVTPEFTRHIDFTYVAGGLPFSGSTDNHLHGWMRFSDGSAPLTNAHLVALIDAWPPVLLQKLRQPAPCASITWSVELVSPLHLLAQPLAADAWLWYEAEIRQAHHGYGHTEARIFSADGTLLALSRQLVAVYDKR